ncbi:hypothetical protein [Kibdelosporangium phytohabitans]|nr:hypothetical protein [Kibdelosporangium phytohabitans]MBE1468067.1 hypothetical protein [Kibdelosporangium phytohabitans]
MGWKDIKHKIGVALGTDEDTPVTDIAERITREAAKDEKPPNDKKGGGK